MAIFALRNNVDDAEFSAIMDMSMPDKLCSAKSKWSGSFRSKSYLGVL